MAGASRSRRRRGRQDPPLRQKPRRRSGIPALWNGGRRLPVLVAGLPHARLLRTLRAHSVKDRRDGGARLSRSAPRRAARAEPGTRRESSFSRPTARAPSSASPRPEARRSRSRRSTGRSTIRTGTPGSCPTDDDSSTSREGSSRTGARSSSVRSTTARPASCRAGRARRSTHRESCSSGGSAFS